MMGIHSWRAAPMSLRVPRVVLCAAAAAALAPTAIAADRLHVRFGVAAFGAVDPLRDVKTVAGCGYDYIEPALSKAVALSPEALAAARRDVQAAGLRVETIDRKSTRLNSSHRTISYAVFCLKRNMS